MAININKDATYKASKPTEKDYKISDGGGLALPALIAREILIRGRYVKAGKMVGFLVICVVLAISAIYELLEWSAAIWLGQGADEFLGTQGDPWDTQSDIFFALIGSVTALLSLSCVHDAQIKRIFWHGDQKPDLRRSTRTPRTRLPKGY